MKGANGARKIREGKYANYFEVGHNQFEFYVDFGQYDPQSQNVQIHTRIVTPPAYAKMMGETLTSSVGSFEREHGPIGAGTGDLDAMEMVRASLESAQAAGRGAKEMRNSADLAASGDSVVRKSLSRTETKF